MSGDNSAAERRLELYFDSVISANEAGASSTQPTHPAGAPAVLVVAGSPATRIVGQPTADSDSQMLDHGMQYPGLSAMGAQPFSVRLGGLAEASRRTSAARPAASPKSEGDPRP